MRSHRRIGLGLAAGALLGGLVAGFQFDSTPSGSKEVLQAAAGVAGVLAGFLTTAKSVLVTVVDRPMVQNVPDEPWNDLMRTIRDAVQINLAMAVVSVISLLLVDHTRSGGACTVIFTSLWLGLFGASVASAQLVASHISWLLSQLRAKPELRG